MRWSRILLLFLLLPPLFLPGVRLPGPGLAVAAEAAQAAADAADAADEGGRAAPSAVAGTAAGPVLRIESSSLDLDAEKQQATATGDVRISYGTMTLQADEVFVDLVKKTSLAKGRVRLLHGEDLLTCDAIAYRWEEETGTVENGDLLVEDTGYHIRAAHMEKTGTDTYQMEDGDFTTCRCESPDDRLPWELHAREGELTVGGYAKVKKATLRILDVPLLYLPRAYVPVKLHRSSGFLVPEMGQSGRHGWEIALPYYWAINASMDATFTLGGLTKRGVKPSLEFRYRPSRKTAGEWRFSELPDSQAGKFRYSLAGEHLQMISRSWYDKVELNVVSDNEYLEDFPGEVGNPADRLADSRGALGFRRGDVHATLEASFSDLVVDTGGEDVAQRLPEMHVDLIPLTVGAPWLTVGWRNTATHFASEKGEQRVRGDFYPMGRILLGLGRGVTLQGYAGLREVVSWDVDGGFGTRGNQQRTLVESGAEVEATLGRGYRWGSYRLHHLIRPRVRYQWIHAVAADPFSVVLDGLDALERRNWVTYSLTNRIWGRKAAPAGAGLKGLAAELYLAQSVDLDRDPEDSPTQRTFSDIRVALRVQPRPYLSFGVDLQIDPYDGGGLRFFEATTGLWTRQRRFGVQLGYIDHSAYVVDPITRVELWDAYVRVYDFPGIEKSIRARFEGRITPHWSGRVESHFLIEESGKVENHFTVSYLSRCECWSVVLQVNQTVRPDDVGFSARFQLEGLGSYF